MTAKEFVLQRLPNAMSERHKSGYGNVYYLIRNGRNTMYLSEGETESKAWIKAKQILTEKEKQIQEQIELDRLRALGIYLGEV